MSCEKLKWFKSLLKRGREGLTCEKQFKVDEQKFRYSYNFFNQINLIATDPLHEPFFSVYL